MQTRANFTKWNH